MIAVVQRVSGAGLTIDGKLHASIDRGFVVLLGVADGDSAEDADYLASKIATLRILDDGDGKMNVSLTESGGSALVVSQFTLLADCRKGRRPSFTQAAAPECGRALYERFVERLRAENVGVSTGVFGARMRVSLDNEGPVTIILDTTDRTRTRRAT